MNNFKKAVFLSLAFYSIQSSCLVERISQPGRFGREIVNNSTLPVEVTVLRSTPTPSDPTATTSEVFNIDSGLHTTIFLNRLDAIESIKSAGKNARGDNAIFTKKGNTYTIIATI